MKILITGSHFTPAVATIEELQKYPMTDIVYVGRKSTREGDSSISVESQELPRMGVKFLSLTTGRLQRHLDLYAILSLLKIPIGLCQAFYIIISEKPDVILSFGGYVAVPIVIAGWLMSIPIIIHEQTLMAGLANKISSIFADKVAVSFEDTMGFSEGKIIVTGNPIRKSILLPGDFVNEGDYLKIFNNAKRRKVPVIFITGGNQGSHVINQIVEKNLRELLKVSCIIHQTGDSEFKDYDRLKLLENDSYLTKKWVGEEIGALLKNTDLVVSRAGMNTLLELAYLKKPIVVVPLPVHTEQMKNARYFENLGFATVLLQKNLGRDFLKTIKKLLSNLPEIKKNVRSVNNIIIEDAAKRLSLETQLLVK